LKKFEDMIEVTNNPNDPRELFVKVKIPLNLVKVSFSVNTKRKYKQIVGKKFQQVTPVFVKHFGPGFTVLKQRFFYKDPVTMHRVPWPGMPGRVYSVRPYHSHPFSNPDLSYYQVRKHFVEI